MSTKPRWHRTCHHATFFRLTCEEYEEQIELTRNRCQLCGIRGEDRPEGLLHIDHAAWIGQWAVRGLLCSPCNAALGTGRRVPRGVPPETVAAYNADPWYRRILKTAGVDETMPEPTAGFAVIVNGRPLRRFGRSWHQVVHAWGPHRITLVPRELAYAYGAERAIWEPTPPTRFDLKAA